LIETGL